MTKDNSPMNEPGLVLDEDFDMNPDLATIKREPSKQKSVPISSAHDMPNSQNEGIEFVLNENESQQSSETQSSASSKDLTVTPPTEVQNSGERMRMGDLLISMGLLTSDQLNVALQEKKISGKMIGEVLVDLGFIDSETLRNVLAKTSGFDVFDPKKVLIDGDALKLFDKTICQKHHVLPFSLIDTELSVAMADPYDVMAMDVIKKKIPKGLKIKTYVSTPQIISEAIDTAYGYASSVSAILKELEGQDISELEEVAGLTEEEAYSHPIVRLVNALIFEAVKAGASDLHFEPEESFVRLRYRKDGVLATVQTLHRQHWNGISQRIKLMASLNIADKLAPQDGRIRMSVGGHDVDFRVSSLPTVHGENIVMRVLDKQASIMPLSSLGFSDANKERIKKAQMKPEGIIIVTGPTGSGKTTTLYSMLNEINSVDVNIQTLEDPVEYSLPMIRQTQIREGVLDFADGIRAMLRQDPDIIFIGEIRDKVTADMALQAAMTGHQVYTTLHTNDSFGALPRLFDLGMVPGMVAGNIISVFAQRLTRTLCDNCKEPHTTTDEECELLGISNPIEIFKAKQGGCPQCDGQGYKGRVALSEILLFDEEMDEIVARQGTKKELNDLAVSKGFKNLKEDAILKIKEGITTFEAVAKVVDITR